MTAFLRRIMSKAPRLGVGAVLCLSHASLAQSPSIWSDVDRVQGDFGLVVAFDHPEELLGSRDRPGLLRLLEPGAWGSVLEVLEEGLGGSRGRELAARLIGGRWVIALDSKGDERAGWVLVSDLGPTAKSEMLGALAVAPRETHAGVGVLTAESGEYLLSFLPDPEGRSIVAISPRSSRPLLHRLIESSRGARGETPGKAERERAGVGEGRMVFRLRVGRGESAGYISGSMQPGLSGWEGQFAAPMSAVGASEHPAGVPISTGGFARLAQPAQAAMGGFLADPASGGASPWTGVSLPAGLADRLELEPGDPVLVLLDARSAAGGEGSRATVTVASWSRGHMLEVSERRDAVMRRFIARLSDDASAPAFGGMLASAARSHDLPLNPATGLTPLFGPAASTAWGYAQDALAGDGAWWIVSIGPARAQGRLAPVEVVRALRAQLGGRTGEPMPIVSLGDVRPSALASVGLGALPSGMFDRIDRIRWSVVDTGEGVAAGRFEMELTPDWRGE